MNSFYFLFIVIMFFLSIMSFSLEFKHILSSLACLELITLTIFMFMSFSLYFIYNELFYSLLYIAIAACEAALGLMIIILYVNKKGNEMFKTY